MRERNNKVKKSTQSSGTSGTSGTSGSLRSSIFNSAITPCFGGGHSDDEFFQTPKNLQKRNFLN